MSMTRAEAVAELEAIAALLEGDLERAQTRDQHISLSMRLGEVRSLALRLSAA